MDNETARLNLKRVKISLLSCKQHWLALFSRNEEAVIGYRVCRAPFRDGFICAAAKLINGI
jgi:hypothetical protein